MQLGSETLGVGQKKSQNFADIMWKPLHNDWRIVGNKTKAPTERQNPYKSGDCGLASKATK